MKLDLSRFDKNIRPGSFKVYFIVEGFGEEYFQVIPGPLVDIPEDTSRYDRINIPAVAEFCDTIIRGIKDSSINIPKHIMTDFARLNKAECTINCSDKFIGSICFDRVYAYHAHEYVRSDDETLNAIGFNSYRASYTATGFWRIMFSNVESEHIATISDTENIDDILAPMLNDMNRYYF